MATFEKLENKKVKVTIEIGAEAFDNAIQEAYFKNRARYNIAGFRKGKAPKRMIENMYGQGIFLEDAFELVYADAYEKAIDELELKPVERPDLSIEKIGEGEGVVFTAEFAVQPEVLLGAYKGIEVIKRAYTVEDEEVEKLLEQEREKVARYVEQERPVQQGDRVLLDYSGSVDGVKFDGGTAKDQQLDIGSGTFIPGFEEQLVGLAKDEEKAIEVTFPEEYHAEELKGKRAVFEVKINGIQVKELPALDDEFAQDVSEFNTLEELRADKRAMLIKRSEQRAKEEMEDEAIDKAIENATLDIPNAITERQMDYMLQDVAYRLSMSGLNLEDYTRYTGTDVATMRESYRKEAERRVRTQLVMDAIGKAENIQATDDDLEQELLERAEKSGQQIEKFKETLKEDDIAYFKERIIAQKTIDFLMENAKLVNEPKKKAGKSKASSEELPEGAPKKSAAKAAAKAPDKEKPAKKPAQKKKADTEEASVAE